METLRCDRCERLIEKQFITGITSTDCNLCPDCYRKHLEDIDKLAERLGLEPRGS